MTRNKFPLLFTMACAIGATSIVPVSNATAAIVLVTPSSMGDWVFNVTDNTGTPGGTATAQMVNGPASPPLGTGSANFLVSPGDESAQLRNGAWAGTLLADITELSYSTYVTSWNGQQAPFVNIYLDKTGGSTYNSRLWFEPDYSSAGAGNGNPSPQPAPTTGSWQTWNMLTGMWYTDDGDPGSNGPGSNAIELSAYLTAYPDARLVNPDPVLGGIRIASGFSSDTDNYNTNVDAFTIGTDGGSTTYNFEAVPEPTSVALAGVGMLALVGYAVRRRKLARA